MSGDVVTGNFPDAPPAPAQRHVFGDPVSVTPSLELDRHQQTERTCSVCGAVKVTVHAPDGSAWREWRASTSAAQRRFDDDLPCAPKIGGAS
ncbi:hypothetical protein PMI42_01703 [Bradyrhizobium sp. YR681]|uniref:hypothetical protein n=1 Tax=Bradyrhizobium sp. YR681 TaxID=1144344 RepID=UPI0002712A4A|nr:hypothetical protein [Bradyrhizobium sp. YR681]EJN14730.1 hypothetical protein PMI42_01703 [Bradyrhizobium sp. YR681]